jgi:hypothetical protein
VRVISLEAMEIRRRRRGIAAAVAWSGFALLLLLSSRSSATQLILADIVAGVASVGLLLVWARYSEIWRIGRWHGHRLKA